MKALHKRPTLTPIAAALLFLFSGHAQANPTGMSVASGTASAVQQGNMLTITNSNNAILNWQQFNIQANETTRFIQPSVSSSVLNRVLTDNPSQILGTLTSNGSVYLINPAGVLVGPNANINVGGLVSSSLNITDANYLAGKQQFETTAGSISANVINQGTISTPQGGQVLLIGQQVTNQGIINTPQGTTILAAGSQVLIGDTATPGVQVAVTVQGNGSAQNLGNIISDAGKVGIVGAAISNTGSISANSAVSEGGRILLKGTHTANISGNISADGDSKGGQIDITAPETTLTAATITAEGQSQGGQIRIGGEYQGGKNLAVDELANAQTLTADKNTIISVNAKNSTSKGGTAILWSDKNTTSHATIKAKGGSQGQGGLIEVSSGDKLVYRGTIENNQGGQVLFDPKNITIATSGQPEIPSTGLAFADNADTDSTIDPSAITYITNQGSAVELQANNDITVNTAITTTPTIAAGGSITLKAGRSILLNANITTGNGDITLTANDPSANLTYRESGAAEITMAAGTSINAGTGTVSITMSPDNQPDPAPTPGQITLNNIAANRIEVYNKGLTATSGITLAGTLDTTYYGVSPYENVLYGGSVLLSTSASDYTTHGDITFGNTGLIKGGDVQLVANNITTSNTGKSVELFHKDNDFSGTLEIHATGNIGSSTQALKFNAGTAGENAYVEADTLGRSSIYLSSDNRIASNVEIYTESGDINLTSPIGVYAYNNITSYSGNITINTNELSFYYGNIGALQGNVTITPYTLSQNFDITEALNHTYAGGTYAGKTLTIGSTSMTGNLIVTGEGNSYGKTSALSLITGGAIQVLNDDDTNFGNLIVAANSLTLQAGTGIQIDQLSMITPTSAPMPVLSFKNTISGDVNIHSNDNVRLSGFAENNAQNGNITLSSNSNVYLSSNTVIKTPNGNGQIFIDTGYSNFINEHTTNNTGIVTGLGGRYVVYAGNPVLTAEDFANPDAFNNYTHPMMTGFSKRYGIVGLTAPAGEDYPQNYANHSNYSTGNWFLYRHAPELTITPNSITTVYGDTSPAVTYTVTGLVYGDTLADSTMGYIGWKVVDYQGDSAALSTAGHIAAGGYLTRKDNTTTTFASPLGYTLSYQDMGYTVTPRPLTISGLTVADKVYDGTTYASISGTPTAISGVLSGDNVTLPTITGSFTGMFSDRHVGNNKTVILEAGLALQGNDAANYSTNSITSTASITQRDSVTWQGSGTDQYGYTNRDWFNAANWKYSNDNGITWITGIVPDGNNVANVYIPSGATINYGLFESGYRPVTGLNYLGGANNTVAGVLNMLSGNLNIGNSSLLGNIKLEGLNLNGSYGNYGGYGSYASITGWGNISTTNAFSLTNAASINLTAGSMDLIAINSRLDVEGTLKTASGSITLTGYNTAPNYIQSYDNEGVRVFADSTIETASGNITITGVSATSGGSSDNDGVIVKNNAVIKTTAGGNISITGYGGIGSYSPGVYLSTGASISTTGSTGNITITGTGSNTNGSYDKDGIVIDGASVGTAGGNITMIGYGGSGESSHGIYLDNNAFVTISGTTGNISIIGSTRADTNYSKGIKLGSDGTTITASTNGNITLNGSRTAVGSTTGGYDADGFYMSSGTISVTNGNLSITGNAYADSSNTYASDNDGIYHSGGIIQSLGSGNMTLAGTGGSGSYSYGVSLKSTIQNLSTLANAPTASISVVGESYNNTRAINLANAALTNSGRTITLNTTMGNITQSVGGLITAKKLTAVAHGGIDLSLNNNISEVDLTNHTDGDIYFKTTTDVKGTINQYADWDVYVSAGRIGYLPYTNSTPNYSTAEYLNVNVYDLASNVTLSSTGMTSPARGDIFAWINVKDGLNATSYSDLTTSQIHITTPENVTDRVDIASHGRIVVDNTIDTPYDDVQLYSDSSSAGAITLNFSEVERVLRANSLYLGAPNSNIVQIASGYSLDFPDVPMSSEQYIYTDNLYAWAKAGIDLSSNNNSINSVNLIKTGIESAGDVKIRVLNAIFGSITNDSGDIYVTAGSIGTESNRLILDQTKGNGDIYLRTIEAADATANIYALIYPKDISYGGDGLLHTSKLHINTPIDSTEIVSIQSGAILVDSSIDATQNNKDAVHLTATNGDLALSSTGSIKAKEIHLSALGSNGIINQNSSSFIIADYLQVNATKGISLIGNNAINQASLWNDDSQTPINIIGDISFKNTTPSAWLDTSNNGKPRYIQATNSRVGYGGNIYGGNISINNTGDMNYNLLARDNILIVNTGSVILPTPTAGYTSPAITSVAGNITIAATNFINNTDSNTGINVSAGKQYWVYSTHPTATVEGMTGYNKHYNQSYVAGEIPSYAEAGNWFLYSVAPKIVIGNTTSSVQLTYGDQLTVGNFTYSGFIDNDDSQNAGITGSVGLTTSLNARGLLNAGEHSITLNKNSLASSLGYDFDVSQNHITVNVVAKALSVTGFAANNKIYDGSASATFSNTLDLDGAISGDNVTLTNTGLATFSNKNVGTDKTVTLNGLGLSGTDAGNYVLSSSPVTSTAEITAKTLTITGFTANDKVYDGNNTTTYKTAGGLNGLVTIDGVTDGIGFYYSSINFDNKNVGSNKTVTATAALAFNDLGNYQLESNIVTSTANISKADLQVTGLSAVSKTYDAGTIAALTGTATVSKLGTDDVTLTGTATGAFADKNVGTAKAVTVTGNSLSGDDAGNYNLVQATGLTADITKANLAVTGLSAVSKTYDAATIAALTGTATVSKLGTDDVALTGTATGVFADKNVGTAKAVTVTGNSLSGDDAANYNLVQATGLTADITKANLAVTGLSAVSKTYDAGTIAALTGTATVSKLGTDDVALTGTATGAFADKNVGSAKAVTVTGNSLSGDDAGNYNLVQATGLTADISKATIEAVTGITANNKTYDGSPTATLVTSGAGFTGKVTNDVLTVTTATGVFSDKNVADSKTVTITGITLGGDDAGNYVLSNSTATSLATITQLDSVTWTGAGNDNNWFNAANWAGSALPDANNVANVVLPANAMIHYNSNGQQEASLTSITGINSSAAGSLNMSAGRLTVGNSNTQGLIRLNSFSQSAGTIEGNANIYTDSLFTQTGGSISLSKGTLTLNTTGTNVDTIVNDIATTDSLSINNTAGSILSAAASTGLKAKDVTLTAQGIGTNAEPVIVDATNIALNSTLGNIYAVLSGAVATNALTINTPSGRQLVSLTAPSFSLSSINSDDDIALTATTGDIIENADATIDMQGNSLSLISTYGNILQYNNAHIINASTANLTAAGRIDNLDISSSGNINAYSGQPMTIRYLNSAGSVFAESTGGLTTNGNITAGLLVDLITHSPMTINGDINAGTGISLTAGTTGDPTAIIIINAPVSTTSGNVGVSAGNGITQNATISAPNGSIDLTTPNYASASGIVNIGVTNLNGDSYTSTTETTAPVTQLVEQTIAQAAKEATKPSAETTKPTVIPSEVNNSTSTTQTNTQMLNNSNQTVGGNTDEFGAKNSTDQGSIDSNKPAADKAKEQPDDKEKPKNDKSKATPNDKKETTKPNRKSSACSV